MNYRKALDRVPRAIVLLTIVALFITAGYGQTKTQGVIKGRSGEKIILQTAENPNLIVLLTDSTDVAQVVGALKARRKQCRWQSFQDSHSGRGKFQPGQSARRDNHSIQGQ